MNALAKLLLRASPFLVSLIASCGKDDQPVDEVPEKQRPDLLFFPEDYDIFIETRYRALRFDVPPYLDAAQTPVAPVDRCDLKKMERPQTTTLWDGKTARQSALFRFESHPTFWTSPAAKTFCVTDTDAQLYSLCQEARRWDNYREEGQGLDRLFFREYEQDENGENRLVGGNVSWGGVLGALTAVGGEAPFFTPEFLERTGSLWRGDLFWDLSESVARLRIRLASTNRESLDQKKLLDAYFSESFPLDEGLPIESRCRPQEGYRIPETQVEIPFYQESTPVTLDSPLECEIPIMPVPEGATELYIEPVPCCNGPGCSVHPGSHIDRIEMGLWLVRRI